MIGANRWPNLASAYVTRAGEHGLSNPNWEISTALQRSAFPLGALPILIYYSRITRFLGAMMIATGIIEFLLMPVNEFPDL